MVWKMKPIEVARTLRFHPARRGRHLESSQPERSDSIYSSSTTSSRASPALSLAVNPITTRRARNLADPWVVAVGAPAPVAGDPGQPGVAARI